MRGILRKNVFFHDFLRITPAMRGILDEAEKNAAEYGITPAMRGIRIEAVRIACPERITPAMRGIPG